MCERGPLLSPYPVAVSEPVDGPLMALPPFSLSPCLSVSFLDPVFRCATFVSRRAQSRLSPARACSHLHPQFKPRPLEGPGNKRGCTALPARAGGELRLPGTTSTRPHWLRWLHRGPPAPVGHLCVVTRVSRDIVVAGDTVRVRAARLGKLGAFPLLSFMW